jgi:hypothetical protein
MPSHSLIGDYCFIRRHKTYGCNSFVTGLSNLADLCYSQGVSILLFALPFAVALVFAFLTFREESR